jgi:hypothetical protein
MRWNLDSFRAECRVRDLAFADLNISDLILLQGESFRVTRCKYGISQGVLRVEHDGK